MHGQRCRHLRLIVFNQPMGAGGGVVHVLVFKASRLGRSSPTGVQSPEVDVANSAGDAEQRQQ